MKVAGQKVIQLAIVDDHQIVIDGLKLLLQGQPHFSIIAEANSAEAMLILLKNTIPDVLITDIMMPGMGGYELTLQVKQNHGKLKVLALSMSEEGAVLAKMIDNAKVDGYIPKAAGKNELVKAIELVAAGEVYYSPQVVKQYDLYKKVQQENVNFSLTTRELEIIQCVIQHLSNREIADKLFISERTVETHRKNIYRKTNTKGEASLVQFARSHLLP